MQQLADRIRKARRLVCLTQTQAAHLLAVNRGTVGHWERGAGHQPTNANLMRLAVLMGVTYEWLATGRGLMQASPVADEGAALRPDCCAHSGDEEALLMAFRKLPRHRRKAIVALVQSGASRAPEKRGAAVQSAQRQEIEGSAVPVHARSATPQVAAPAGPRQCCTT